MTDRPMIDTIHQLAELYRESVRGTGIDLQYDERSVMLLDEIIVAGFGGNPPAEDQIERMVEFFGSFLGVAMESSLGMQWTQREEDGQWVLTATAPNGDICKFNPFNKVYKRFLNGDVDSLSYCYQMIKKFLIGELPV